MSQRFQFSLRSLFWLTAVVAVVVGTMSTLGRTQQFRALGSYHAYMALLPIAVVWSAWRVRPLLGNNFFKASALLFVLSLVLPCFLSDYNLAIGLFAVIISVIGVFQLQPEASGMWLWLACWLGVITNGSFIAVLYRGTEKQKRGELLNVAWIPLATSVLVLITLGLSGYLDAIYIGYGVWVAAMLAMWLGVREEVTTDRAPS